KVVRGQKGRGGEGNVCGQGDVRRGRLVVDVRAGVSVGVGAGAGAGAGAGGVVTAGPYGTNPLPMRARSASTAGRYPYSGSPCVCSVMWMGHRLETIPCSPTACAMTSSRTEGYALPKIW